MVVDREAVVKGGRNWELRPDDGQPDAWLGQRARMEKAEVRGGEA